MSHTPNFVRCILLATLTLAACSTPLARRAQRADGLLDFLAGNPGEIEVPIEKVSDRRGRIETARVLASGGVAYVTGYVRRTALGDPQPAAHVDVYVLDARRRVVETKVAIYMPRAIPRGRRGRSANSHYTVSLAALPPPGATVEVRFHDSPLHACGFTAAPAPTQK